MDFDWNRILIGQVPAVSARLYNFKKITHTLSIRK